MVTVAAQFGGAPCPRTSMSASCGLKGCPVGCIVSTWGSWSACAVSCSSDGASGDQKIRVRDVDISPVNGGESCPATQESFPCTTEPCPMDCVATAWASWQSCLDSCTGCDLPLGALRRIQHLMCI